MLRGHLRATGPYTGHSCHPPRGFPVHPSFYRGDMYDERSLGGIQEEMMREEVERQRIERLFQPPFYGRRSTYHPGFNSDYGDGVVHISDSESEDESSYVRRRPPWTRPRRCRHQLPYDFDDRYSDDDFPGLYSGARRQSSHRTRFPNDQRRRQIYDHYSDSELDLD